MTTNQKRFALAGAVLFQLLIIVSMFAKSAYPLWVGDEVRVKTIPVDPRSMFRGNYARLRYEFQRLPDGALSDHKPSSGEVVYVNLKRGDDGLFAFSSATYNEPSDGVFLKGRIDKTYEPYGVDFGIDAFFAPKKDALKLEADLREGGVAVLMVTQSGQVALKDVVPN